MKETKSSMAKLRKAFLIALALGLALLFGATSASEKYAEQELLSQLQERFGGPASLDDFNISIFGSVSMEGLKAMDENKESVLELKSFEASLSLLSILTLYPKFDASLDGFELTLRQRPDESWNYEGWSTTDSGEEEAADTDEESSSPQGELEQLPFFGSMRIAEGRVLLMAQSGTTTIENIHGGGGVEKGETEARMAFDAELVPSAMLRASGALEEKVGLHMDLNGDLAQGPEQANWQFAMGLVNGAGQLKLDGTVSPAVLLGDTKGAQAGDGLNLRFDASSLGMNAKLMPLLAMLHPVFQSMSGLDASAIGGLLDGSLNLTYRGSLPTQNDPLAWLANSLEAISGGGSLAIDGARLGDAPMLQKMVDYLGIKGRELNLSPLSFQIANGRVNYDKGWDWKLGGVLTSFSGSIGLDGSLDLNWSAPVTDQVIAKHSFLKHLKGKLIGIPVGGSLKSPVFNFEQALESVGSELVQGQLLDKLGLEEVPDLDGLGKLGLDSLGLGPAKEGSQDPGELLKQANRLWDAGQKAEAAVIYKVIRSEHGSSLTYRLNRSKIKSRGKHSG